MTLSEAIAYAREHRPVLAAEHSRVLAAQSEAKVPPTGSGASWNERFPGIETVQAPGGLAASAFCYIINTPSTLGAYGRIERSVGPVAIERNNLARVAHVYMTTEGRDVGSAAADLERKLKTDARTRKQLMRDTFGGLGMAIGLAVMMVFMN